MRDVTQYDSTALSARPTLRQYAAPVFFPESSPARSRYLTGRHRVFVSVKPDAFVTAPLSAPISDWLSRDNVGGNIPDGPGRKPKSPRGVTVAYEVWSSVETSGSTPRRIATRSGQAPRGLVATTFDVSPLEEVCRCRSGERRRESPAVRPAPAPTSPSPRWRWQTPPAGRWCRNASRYIGGIGEDGKRLGIGYRKQATPSVISGNSLAVAR